MDRAAKAVRRSGIRLMSLTGGHAELNMVLSELKDVRNAARALAAAQNSAAQYMIKWSCGEENRAIQDVVGQMVELNLLYTEVQAEFADHLKAYRQMFEFIHEGERHVDQAKAHLNVCDQRESKVKKELKKAAKKATNEELNHLEKKLSQAERARDLAQLELADRVRDNEAVKLIRFKDGLLKLSNAYVELGKKCAIIHEAQRDIALLLPDVHEKDIEDIKYTGSGATKQYVVKAKEKIRLHNRQARRHRGVIDDRNLTNLEDPPPPYSEGDFFSLSCHEPETDDADNLLLDVYGNDDDDETPVRGSLHQRGVAPAMTHQQQRGQLHQQQQESVDLPQHHSITSQQPGRVSLPHLHDMNRWDSDYEDDLSSMLGAAKM